MNRVYVICYEGEGRTSYFMRIGLGVFWESGPRDWAKEFTSRALATKVLHESGRHREGWRIITDTPIAKVVTA